VAGASLAAGGDAPPSAQAIAARALDSARRHHCLPSPLSPPTLDPIITVVLVRIPAAGAPTPAQLHHESAVSIPSLCSSDCAEAITDDDASSLLRPSAARPSSSTTKKKFLYSSCRPVYCLRRMCCSLRSLRGHVLCNFRSWKCALCVHCSPPRGCCRSYTSVHGSLQLGAGGTRGGFCPINEGDHFAMPSTTIRLPEKTKVPSSLMEWPMMEVSYQIITSPPFCVIVPYNGA